MDFNATLFTPKDANLPRGTYIATGIAGVTLLAQYLEQHPKATVLHLLISDSTPREINTRYGYCSLPDENPDVNEDNYYYWGELRIRRKPRTDDEEEELENLRHRNAMTDLRLKRAIRELEAPLTRVLDRAGPTLESLAFVGYMTDTATIHEFTPNVRMDPRVAAMGKRTYPSLKELVFLHKHICGAANVLEDSARFPALTHLHVSDYVSSLTGLLRRFPHLTHLLLGGATTMHALPAELNPVEVPIGWMDRLKGTFLGIPNQKPHLIIPANVTFVVQPGYSAGVEYDKMFACLSEQSRVLVKFPIEEARSGGELFPLQRTIADFVSRASGAVGQWADPGPLPPQQEWWWNLPGVDKNKGSLRKDEIRALLRSQLPPPDSIAESMPAIHEELVQGENEMLRLKAQLADAEARHAILKEHYELGHGLFAPIRCLPSEILLRIFEDCQIPTDDPDSAEPRMSSRVSQVCIRWHEIVMGTPTLWNNIELDSSQLGASRARVRKVVKVLKAVLDRGGNTPLTFDLSILDGKYFAGVLELLAEHCERWKTARFMCDASNLRYLASIKGRLPLLETVDLDTFRVEPQDSVYLSELFAAAPRLKAFAVGGSLPPTVAQGHLHKLHEFGCIGQDPQRAAQIVTFMSGLPPTLGFRFQIRASGWAREAITNIPLTSSNIASLSMDTWDELIPEECVAAIFACLTLPRLRELSFKSQEGPCAIIYWPHSAFVDLAARSSFDTHLHSLSLCQVTITETELVGALGLLALLQHLEIWDHQTVHNRGENQLLITNSLFAALTLKTDPHPTKLVPRLRSLVCQSLMQFDDHAYLDFLLSRRRPTAPFSSRMQWWPGHRRPLDAEVAARLRDLCVRKELVCEFSRADIWA
ncbi:hypothetical protein DFH06DRAFT_660771 [Mycena polygramma]|nr:hypothetical protein DFH06DRAFT_660771 [Mycena polygramma]